MNIESTQNKTYILIILKRTEITIYMGWEISSLQSKHTAIFYLRFIESNIYFKLIQSEREKKIDFYVK